MIVEDMKKMAESNLIHGDLSEYNILLWKNLPFIIDFSQGVRKNHPLATEFLRKDVENNPDAYQYERAEKFNVTQRAIGFALQRLKVSYKKKPQSSKS